MSDELAGRRILVVDDDVEVCEALEMVLTPAEVDYANSYEAARAKLENGQYDVVILDIMGVRGHELLDLFGREFACIMLTGKALTPDSFRSAVGGHARLFLPKEELPYLDQYVAEVLSADRDLWPWLLKRLDLKRWLGSSFSVGEMLELARKVQGRDDEPPEGG
jgi:DNA-binding NtrC family response regulator